MKFYFDGRNDFRGDSRCSLNRKQQTWNHRLILFELSMRQLCLKWSKKKREFNICWEKFRIWLVLHPLHYTEQSIVWKCKYTHTVCQGTTAYWKLSVKLLVKNIHKIHIPVISRSDMLWWYRWIELYAVGSSSFQTCFNGVENFVLRQLVHNGTRF